MKKRPIRRKNQRIEKTELPLFGPANYILMLAGAVLIFTGFLIMGIEMEINGFWSLYVSPWLILAGFITFGYAIIKRNPALDKEQEKPA